MVNTARQVTAYRAKTDGSTGSQSLTPAPTQTAVKFWGVRGSVPTPTPAHQRYGGNTVCVEITMGQQRIICDGGTGIVGLGHHLAKQNALTQAHMIFTHTQWDRIQGFPFFQPAFIAGNQFSIYGGVAPNGASIKHCLTDQMLKPHFAMPLQNMRAELNFHTVNPQEQFCIGDVTVETIQTNPASFAMGYRFTHEGSRVVYATDTPTECIDADFLAFADSADILIYDGTYADLSYLKSDGSVPPNETNTRCDSDAVSSAQPWELGIEIAQKARVKKLVLLHHSPVQDDDALDQLQQAVQNKFNNVSIAHEGLTITL